MVSGSGFAPCAPRCPGSRLEAHGAGMQPAASSPGIPRIAAEFAESYYSQKLLFLTLRPGRARGEVAGCVLVFFSLWDSWLCFLTQQSQKVPDSGHAFGAISAFSIDLMQVG